MSQRILIFDASTLITLSMNGLIDILEELKKNFSGKFIITKEVKYETFERPVKIKRFELSALRVKDLIDKKILENPQSIGISDETIKKKADEILNFLNNTFFARGKFMHVIDRGEASCLALSLLLSEKRIENVVAMDERTGRMIGEKPGNLEKLFEKKLHTGVKMKRKPDFLKNIKYIRSSELVYIAYKKGLIKLKNGVLDALLWAVKFKGCSISKQEIERIKKL